PDGRYVAFRSSAALLPQDTNNTTDVYVFDTLTATLSLASINQARTASGNGASGFNTGPDSQRGGLDFSGDGHALVFLSSATDLTPGVTTAHGTPYLRNLTTGTPTLLTPNQAGTDGGDGDAQEIPSLSADGRYVVLDSDADNLVTGDTNRVKDIFL